MSNDIFYGWQNPTTPFPNRQPRPAAQRNYVIDSASRGADMADKTITLELTEQEGAIVWDLLEQRSKATLPMKLAYQFGVMQGILSKITAASQAAGIGVYKKSDIEEPKK